MDSAMRSMNPAHAAEILSAARGRKIIVYGDVMLDEFVWGEVTRISPEAPVPVVDIRRESVRLGGAANVWANLYALGAQAVIVGVTGNDHAGERLRAELTEKGATEFQQQLIIDATRPTTIKTRIIAHSQLVVRADRESRATIDAGIAEQLIETLTAALDDAAALIVSDYDKGAVAPAVLEKILPRAHERGVPVLIDPKIKNFNAYRPATLVTPNHHEALRLTNTDDHSDAGLAVAARAIQAQLGCAAVLVTRGERGMLLIEKDNAPVYVPTVAREVYDVTGAGDTVIATLGAALAAGASLTDAAILANYAAGVVVGKVGTAIATSEEIIRAIDSAKG